MKKKLPVWLIVLISVCGAALLFALVLLGRYIYVMFYNPMSAFEAPTPAPVHTAAPTAAVFATPTARPTLSPEEELALAADLSYMQNRVNILLLGWDQSPERTESGSDVYRDEANNFRSDVIMLLSVDFENSTAALISVPRDTYAPIYKSDGTLWKENSHYKINAAFAKGGSAAGEGFGYAMATVSHLLGVPISNFVGVDMEGLKVVVNAMGGVDYDVDVEIRLNGRLLQTGFQHLNGQQVLDYCRARKGISTDVGRNDRQQRMLFTIFQQLQSKKQLANFPKIYTSVKDYIHTDLTFEQICALCKFGLTLSMDKLSRHTLEGEYINKTAYSGASYYVLHNQQLVLLMQQIFGIDITPDNRYDALYVQADKSAAIALQYVAAAEALYTVYGYSTDALEYDYSYFTPQDVLDVNQAIAQVKAAALRVEHPEYSEEEYAAYMQQPLEQAAIDAATASIHQAMLTFCTNHSLHRGNVDKKLLPAALYEALPKPPEIQ